MPQTCDGGTRDRTYAVQTASGNGGVACPADSPQSIPCNTQACSANVETQDCEGAWEAWTTCSASCGAGTRTRSYSVVTESANGGAACPATLVESEGCDEGACPVDCVGSWGDFSDCSEVRLDDAES